MTAVRFCVSTFVSVKQVDVFDAGPRYVILLKCDTPGYFWGEFSSCGYGEKTGILSQTMILFQPYTSEEVMVPKPNRAQAQCCHKV